MAMTAVAGLPHVSLTRPRSLIAFLLSAGVIAPAVSAAAAATVLRRVAGAPFGPAFQHWFLADALGLLVVAPILLTADVRNLGTIARPGRRAEAVVLAVLIPSVSAVVFQLDANEWLFLLVPLVLVPAFRVGFEGAALAVLASAAGGIAGMLWHAGHDEAFHRVHLVSMQMFLLTEVLTALPIATLVQTFRANEAKANDSTAVLEREKERYEELARTLPVGIYRYRIPIGAPQYFEYVSPTFCSLFGVDQGAILRDAQVVFDAAHPDDREGLIRANQLAASTRSPFRWEGRLVVGGVIRWVQIASDPTPEPGGGSLWSGVVTDITAQRQAEAAQKRAQQLTQDILKTTPYVIYIYDLREHRNVYSNLEITHVLGLSPDEAAGRGDHLFAEVLHPDDLELVAAHHARLAVLPDDRTLELEYRMRHTLGHWVTLRSRDRVFARDDEGRVTQIIGAAVDITEHRRAEEALTESRERFRTMFEEAPLGVALIDSLTGRILQVNARYAAIVERTPEEMTSIDWMRITHPDDVQSQLDLVAPMLAGITPGFDMQKRYVKPDGTWVWVHLTVARIVAGDPRMPRHLAMVEDITERMRWETALQKERDLLHRLTETSPVGITFVDRSGQIVFANTGATRILGLSRDAITGLQYNAPAWRITADDGGPFPEGELPFVRVMTTGQPVYDVRHAIEWPDGRRVWLSVNAAPLLDDEGHVNGMIATVEDVGERRQAEQRLQEVLAQLERRVQDEVNRAMAGERALIQQSRLAAMGEMIVHIAHQWRQPLNALGMVMANLREAHRTGELTQASIDEAVGHGFGLIRQMSSTISDFTEFFRPDKAAVPFAVRDQVERALSLVRASFHHHGITVTVTGGDGVVTQGFPGEYSQVLLNLLSNARDALLHRDATERSVEIRIDAIGPHCCVTIADSGGGIPVEPPERVFEPYFTTKAGGIGLGLYMSKTILEQSMHGTISVANGPRGAELIIRTPLVEREPHAGR